MLVPEVVKVAGFPSTLHLLALENLNSHKTFDTVGCIMMYCEQYNVHTYDIIS